MYVYSTSWVTQSQKNNDLDYTIQGRIIMIVYMLRILNFLSRLFYAAYKARKSTLKSQTKSNEESEEE